LAESLLFGHERGSFTGASETREGLFKQADGGTIFLDEIGDLDLEVQKSLLRVLHDRRFRPLSSKKEITSDFRWVAATNRNLEDMVRDGLFRKDLYHRLCNRVIHLPPLRERKEDIQPIATHYVQAICDELECMPKEISHDLLRALTLYDWPGNVRELINTLRATVHNGISEHRLYPQHLPIQIRTKVLISAKDRNASEDYLVISGTQKVSAPDTMSEQNTIKIFDDDICAASGKSVVTSGLLPVQHPEETADQLHNPTAENDDPTENSRYIRISIYNDHAPQDGFLNLRTFRELAMREVEFAYLKQLLSLSQGNFQRAQQLSGLSRARLYDLLSKHAMTLNSVNAQARASATDVFAPR
jgi:DNA-binding NtrC family response regulator